MKKAKRKIVIFVDNCAAYSKDSNNFSNIKVHFLPPNSTSVLQPMDQGIINVFKQYYRKRLVKWMLEKLNNTGELRKVSVLESIHFILSERELITPSVIANCSPNFGDFWQSNSMLKQKITIYKCQTREKFIFLQLVMNFADF